MGDFFRGWKRKTGCVALVMALIFVGGWVRSLTIQDSINIPCGKSSLQSFDSVDQSLIWSRFDEMDSIAIKFPTWESGSAGDLDYSPIHDFVGCHRQYMGFGIGNVPSERTLGPVISFWFVPYWSIVIPLTLLSAYLLLSKPRSPSS